MRKGLLAVLALLMALGFWTGCDQKNEEVLIDDVKTVKTDSTRLDILMDVADTTSLVITGMVNAERWTSSVESSGTGWCSISPDQGETGDTLYIYAKENFSRSMRSTFVRIEAGTLIQRFWVRQDGKGQD